MYIQQGLIVVVVILAASAAAISDGEYHTEVLISGDALMTHRERDYARHAAAREWDRLMTWHAGDTAKRCYKLGNPQYYPDSLYDRILEECESLEKYDCWFTSGDRLYQDENRRREESKRAYKKRYQNAYSKCEAAKTRQKKCLDALPWHAMGSSSKCPLEDEQSCTAPVLSEMRNWGPGAFMESEFCIKKK